MRGGTFDRHGGWYCGWRGDGRVWRGGLFGGEGRGGGRQLGAGPGLKRRAGYPQQPPDADHGQAFCAVGGLGVEVCVEVCVEVDAVRRSDLNNCHRAAS